MQVDNKVLEIQEKLAEIRKKKKGIAFTLEVLELIRKFELGNEMSKIIVEFLEECFEIKQD